VDRPISTNVYGSLSPSGGPAARDPAARGPAVRDPAARGPAVRDPAARGPAVRDPAARGPAVRGPAARDPAVRGSAARDPAIGEPANGGRIEAGGLPRTDYAGFTAEFDEIVRAARSEGIFT
jgi:hypothetical protein